MASIEKRGNSYRITVSLSRDIYGKKLYKKATFTPDPSLSEKKKQKAVEDFARDFENQVKNGLVMDGRNVTLKEFVDLWRTDYAPGKIEESSLNSYNAEFDRILPKLGHFKLTELKPHILNAFFVSMSKDGARKDGKSGGYSKNTIAKTKAVLSSVLSTAVEWEIIAKNPCENVHFDAEPAAERIKYFTPEQAISFIEFIDKPYYVNVKGHKRVDDTGKTYEVGGYAMRKEMPEQLKVCIILALYTGMRKGELVALKWSDIDFENNIISVSASTAVVKNKQGIKAPKTRSSHRKVSIPRFLTERLAALHADREKYRADLMDYWEGDDWVFIQHNGKQISYYTPYSAFHDAIIRYNDCHEDQLPVIALHGLRHTSATLLISNKTDISTVSSRLGHAKTSTTMNIYAHALESAEQKSAETLENILNKKK